VTGPAVTGKPGTGDFRRALVLLPHGIRADDQGLRTIIEEADQAGRLERLPLALVSILWQLAPQLLTAGELADLRNFLDLAACAEEVGPGMRLAARLAVA
jgi:hypothetical protein